MNTQTTKKSVRENFFALKREKLNHGCLYSTYACDKRFDGCFLSHCSQKERGTSLCGAEKYLNFLFVAVAFVDPFFTEMFVFFFERQTAATSSLLFTFILMLLHLLLLDFRSHCSKIYDKVYDSHNLTDFPPPSCFYQKIMRVYLANFYAFILSFRIPH